MDHRPRETTRKGGVLVVASLLAVSVLGLSARAWQDAPIDFQKAQRLRQRLLNGEDLPKEDRDYLERARESFRKKQAAKSKVREAAGRDFTGLVPLTDRPADRDAAYQDQDYGLYGADQNAPPAAHRALALRASAEIQPRDAAGKPAADGKVGLISLGMSNTTQEFSRFMTLLSRDAARSPALVVVDGAQGGMEASTWSDAEKVRRMGRPDPWSVLDQRLQRSGMTAAQVQAVWIKQARAQPESLGDFPRHAEVLRDDLAVILGKLTARFPNLKIAYLSSRIYAGYATTALNPEPYAYESAFSVRWLIRDQIAGKPELNADPARGDVKAPVLLWGPYLWADGVKGRKAHDLVWNREDLGPDGTHPSASGQQKVAVLLLNFFKTDPTSKPWFLARARAD